MQDEVTKHANKIFREVKNTRHSFSEKLKEILTEILIIVFAVTVSIWLHNWSEHRHEQHFAAAFLQGLKEDLTKDVRVLEENRKREINQDSNYEFLLQISPVGASDENLPIQIHHHLTYELTTTHLNVARYEGFKSSGKIETIGNQKLKEKILVFYQQTVNDVTDLEVFLNNWQLKILDLDVDKNNKLAIRDFVTSDKMKSLLQLAIHNFKILDGYYAETIKRAKEIIAEIEKTEK